jgi:hypothetical protein
VRDTHKVTEKRLGFQGFMKRRSFSRKRQVFLREEDRERAGL